MSLLETLESLAARRRAVVERFRLLAAQPLTVALPAAALDDPTTGRDRTEAQAIKRGQRPEQVAALKKALGIATPRG